MVTVAPRLFSHGGRLYLMSAQVSLGKILAMSGPYQCVSGPDVAPETFVNDLIGTLHRACEVAPLTIEDLDEAMQEQVRKSLDPAPEASEVP